MQNSILHFDGIDYYNGYNVNEEMPLSKKYNIYQYVYDTVFDVGIPLYGLIEIKGTKNDCNMPIKTFKKEVNRANYAFWTNCKYHTHEQAYVFTLSFSKMLGNGQYPDTVVTRGGFKYIDQRRLMDSLFVQLHVYAQNQNDLELGIQNAQFSLEGVVPEFSKKIAERYTENPIEYFEAYWDKLGTYLQPLYLLKHTNPSINFDTDGPSIDNYKLLMGFNHVHTSESFKYDSICRTKMLLSETEFLYQLKEKQVVIYGEDHYNPKARKVINTTLDTLSSLGFKDIFFEALQLRHSISQNKFLSRNDGFYTNEMEMAGLIRKAIRLGLRIHAYDEPYQFCDTCTTQLSFMNFREKAGMNNILDTIQKYKVEKFVVVSGYGHANKGISKSGFEPLANHLTKKFGNEAVAAVKMYFQEKLYMVPEISYLVKSCQSSGFDYEIILNSDYDQSEKKRFRQRGYDKLLNLKKYKLDKNVVTIIPLEAYKDGQMIPYFISHPDSPKYPIVPIYSGEFIITVQDILGNRLKKKTIKI